MINHFKKSLTLAFAVTTGIFTFVPESFFENYVWISQDYLKQCKLFSKIDANSINVFISRFVCLGVVSILTLLVRAFFLKIRRWVTIKGQNYTIKVEYGNILKKRKCKRVINFDECFTTQVGENTAEVNPKSICGQYLLAHPDLDVQQLINDANIKPARSKSNYQQKTRYESGTIVPNGDDLLMAFAKLDENGKGRFYSRDEYIKCLDLLWKELENYYAENDVCIPILGSGTTVIDGGAGASIPQQDLLDMIIWSYKLSSHKIKAPHKLCIVCRKNDDFSINKIEN